MQPASVNDVFEEQIADLLSAENQLVDALRQVAASVAMSTGPEPRPPVPDEPNPPSPPHPDPPAPTS